MGINQPRHNYASGKIYCFFGLVLLFKISCRADVSNTISTHDHCTIFDNCIVIIHGDNGTHNKEVTHCRLLSAVIHLFSVR